MNTKQALLHNQRGYARIKRHLVELLGELDVENLEEKARLALKGLILSAKTWHDQVEKDLEEKGND